MSFLTTSHAPASLVAQPSTTYAPTRMALPAAAPAATGTSAISSSSLRRSTHAAANPAAALGATAAATGSQHPGGLAAGDGKLTLDLIRTSGHHWDDGTRSPLDGLAATTHAVLATRQTSRWTSLEQALIGAAALTAGPAHGAVALVVDAWGTYAAWDLVDTRDQQRIEFEARGLSGRDEMNTGVRWWRTDVASASPGIVAIIDGDRYMTSSDPSWH